MKVPDPGCRIPSTAGAEHIFVRTADAVEYALEQQLVVGKGKESPAIAAL